MRLRKQTQVNLHQHELILGNIIHIESLLTRKKKEDNNIDKS